MLLPWIAQTDPASGATVELPLMTTGFSAAVLDRLARTVPLTTHGDVPWTTVEFPETSHGLVPCTTVLLPAIVTMPATDDTATCVDPADAAPAVSSSPELLK